MPYITIPISPKQHQVSFEDIMFGDDEDIFRPIKDTYDTKTVWRDITPQALLEKLDVQDLINTLKKYNEQFSDIVAAESKEYLYRFFSIPKASGGLRPIAAPEERLSDALHQLKNIFEIKFSTFYRPAGYKINTLYHTCAMAYIKNRSVITAVERHRNNESKWFLKTDLHNFFGSINIDFAMKMLGMIYPFSEVVKSSEGKDELRKAISTAFLNNGLPQGTPFSPMFTNIVMIPIDHAIAKMCRENSPFLIYTRYADDMFISSRYEFEDRELIFKIHDKGKLYSKTNSESLKNQLDEMIEKTNIPRKIHDIFRRIAAPFELSYKKTSYGNTNGSNWMLGVQINKDNEITLGAQKRNLLRVDIYNFTKDYLNGKPWSPVEAMELQGRISWHRSVNKEDTDKILKKYSNKFHKDISLMLKNVISG